MKENTEPDALSLLSQTGGRTREPTFKPTKFFNAYLANWRSSVTFRCSLLLFLPRDAL